MYAKLVTVSVVSLGLLFFGSLRAYASVAAVAADTAGLWTDVPAKSVAALEGRIAAPARARTMTLNLAGMTELLAGAPPERDVAAPDSRFEMVLPLPEGGFGRFRLVESSIMEPGLAKRYPMLKTYLGQGIDSPTATARIDLTTRGFRAQVISNTHTSYIEPLQQDDVVNYAIFNKADARKTAQAFTCGVTGQEVKSLPNLLKRNNIGNLASGANLRTYRLAVAATGEYTAALGGTVLDGLSGITTTINRVNGIYERELAVRMILVANNDALIYTNGATDPYTNSSASTMLGENQTNLTALIGTANYDIGHVFSTFGGGVAGLGVVCDSTRKARGTTGLSNPRADGFDVDLVAHEMGHQFDGSHTFNGSGGNCGGNRSASTAYEAGSGVTMQSYAGSCGADATQRDSEDFFHRISLDEMLSFTTGTGGGASCGVVTATGNTPPTVTTAPAFTIPKSTPFTLTATGNDGNGDPLTYVWEQFDLGAANAEGVIIDNGGPLFRNFAPSPDPIRTFPSLRYILNNANVAPAAAPLPGTTTPNFLTAELLPSTSRTMNFRVTVRDNRAGGGGTNDAATVLTVAAAAGPFAVTQPNTAVSWAAGSTQTVTWSVAATDIAPVSTANVQIALSTDGGLSFPIILAASVPNNGAATVIIPAGTASSTQARIRVAAVGNVFFDISDVNFTVTGANTPPTLTVTGSVSTSQGAPSVTRAVATVTDAQDLASALTVSVSQVPPEMVVTVINNSGTINLTASAACTLVAPTSGSKTYPLLLTVTDSGGSKTSQWVNVLVSTNLPPTLGTYSDVNLLVGTSTTVVPTAAISDVSGNIAAASVSPATLPGGGTVAIAANGTVMINSTGGTALGSYTVRAQAADSCGAVRVRQFMLNVRPPAPVISVTSSQILTGSGGVAVQPNECNQLTVTLANNGFATATGVSATLSTSTPSVTIVQPTATFVDIIAGQTQANGAPFRFTTANALACASNVGFSLTVNYTGGGSPTVLPLNFAVGAPATTTENFDAITAPALPAGWTTARTGTTPPALWSTTNTAADSAPNVAVTLGAASAATNSLVSRPFLLPASTTRAVLSFRHAWNFESDGGSALYDGAILELSSDGGTTFNNIGSAAVGATFSTGPYSGTIATGFGNPLGGQPGWGGVQASFVTTTLQLPLALNGQTVQFRFRAGWDQDTANAGANWRVDSLSLQAGSACASPGGGACATSSHTVGGTVTGLTGSGLVLRNNGGNNLSIPTNGTFTFSSPVSNGAPYAVTVFSRPQSPAQGCKVSNGAGLISGANVTGVAVACVVQPLNLDDSDPPDEYAASTDGLILLRYLFGLRGVALTQGILATNPRRTAAQVESHIVSILAGLDVDLDGSTKATTDGLLIVRRLLGLSGTALINGARNSNRSDTAVGNAIDALRP